MVNNQSMVDRLKEMAPGGVNILYLNPLLDN